MMSAPSPSSRKHIRSSSDFVNNLSSDLGLPPPHSRRSNIHNKPPLRSIVTTPGTAGVLGIPMPPPPKEGKRMHHGHRRSKSEVPFKNVSFSGLTKNELLNFPDPRWAAPKFSHRKRTGSGDVLLEGMHSRGSSSGAVGYGSITAGGDNKSGGGMHVRTKSDMSFSSAVTDLTKSALIREITEGGRIRFQLPKDNFRILMDSSLGEYWFV
jgi:hypothetical protein